MIQPEITKKKEQRLTKPYLTSNTVSTDSTLGITERPKIPTTDRAHYFHTDLALLILNGSQPPCHDAFMAHVKLKAGNLMDLVKD